MRIAVLLSALITVAGCGKESADTDGNAPTATTLRSDPPAIVCADLLSPADLEEVCGHRGTWQPSVDEGQPPALCSRKSGQSGAHLYFHLEAHKDESSARTRTADVAEGKVKFRISSGGAVTTESALARKGALAIIVNNLLTDADASRMCTARQLTKLAQRVAARLP